MYYKLWNKVKILYCKVCLIFGIKTSSILLVLKEMASNLNLKV